MLFYWLIGIIYLKFILKDLCFIYSIWPLTLVSYGLVLWWLGLDFINLICLWNNTGLGSSGNSLFGFSTDYILVSAGGALFSISSVTVMISAWIKFLCFFHLQARNVASIDGKDQQTHIIPLWNINQQKHV